MNDIVIDTGIRAKHREMIKVAAIDLVKEMGINQLTLSLLSKKAGVPANTTKGLFVNEQEVLLGSCIQCFAKMTAILFRSNLRDSTLNQGLQSVWLNYQLFSNRYAKEATFIQQFLRDPSALYGTGSRANLRKLLQPFIGYLSYQKRHPVSDVQALMIITLLGNNAGNGEIALMEDGGYSSRQVFFTSLLPKIEKILELPIYDLAC
ncbi:hypothetical protein GCM10023149_25230 [Mucilaginibacter gynuensis]|uniref:TetR family transcriptional regulator n=1 Tax=Mucilaginibacter gynuensis TaxID=1302236 RepID=A0ABP8GGY0_9SPHI